MDICEKKYERRKVLKSVGAATPLMISGRNHLSYSNGDTEKIGEVSFVESSIRYEPRGTYPVIHWDSLPELTVTTDDKLKIHLIKPEDLDKFRNRDAMVAYKDITDTYHYHGIDKPTTVPRNETREITTGIDSYVRAQAYPKLPAVFKSDGEDVTVRTGDQLTRVARGEQETIRLPERPITISEKGVKKEDATTPILTVENHGSVEVHKPPQEVLDKLV